MPIYEYACTKCKKEHEIIQKFSDDPITTCPDCGGEMKKLISNTSFVLKGTGWYATDYASPEKKKDSPSDKKKDTSKSSSDKKKDAAPAGTR